MNGDLQKTTLHVLNGLIIPRVDYLNDVMPLFPGDHQIETQPSVKWPQEEISNTSSQITKEDHNHISKILSMNNKRAIHQENQSSISGTNQFEQILSKIASKMDAKKLNSNESSIANQLHNSSIDIQASAQQVNLNDTKSVIGNKPKPSPSSSVENPVTVNSFPAPISDATSIPHNEHLNSTMSSSPLRCIEEHVEELCQMDLESTDLSSSEMLRIHNIINNISFQLSRLSSIDQCSSFPVDFDEANDLLKRLSMFCVQMLATQHDTTLKVAMKEYLSSSKGIISQTDDTMDVGNIILSLTSGLLSLELCMIIVQCGTLPLVWSQIKNIEKTNLKLISHEIFQVCLNFLKDQVNDNLIFLLDHELKSPKSSMIIHLQSNVRINHSLVKMSSLISQTLSFLMKYMSIEALTEDLIISFIYLCIGVFQLNFSSPCLFNSLKFGSIQEQSTLILEYIFCHYPEHQVFIIDEIIGTMIRYMDDTPNKNLYRLSNGIGIHPLSALTFSLFQSLTCHERIPHDLLLSNLSTNESPDLQEELSFSLKEKYAMIIKPTWDNMLSKMNYLIKALVARCFPKDQEKTKSNENGHKQVFDSFVMDIIHPLFETEWPVMEYIGLTFSKFVFQTLDEEKKSIDSTVKTTSMNWIGELYKKIYSFQKKFESSEWKSHIEEVASKEKRIKLDPIYQTIHFHLLDNLTSCRKKSAKQFYILQFLNRDYTLMEDKNHHNVQEYLQKHVSRLSQKVTLINKSIDNNKSLSNDYLVFLHLNQPIGKLQEAITSRIIRLLNADMVTFRSKALRIVQDISFLDRGFLANPSIFQTVMLRLTDSSPHVRDTTIELLSKLLLQKDSSIDKAILEKYYPLLSERIMDVGTNVRKRCVRLLKEVYLSLFQSQEDVNKNQHILSDCLVKIIGRMHDEEDTVRELAIKCLHQILFACLSSGLVASSPQQSDEGEFISFLSLNLVPWRSLNAFQQSEIRTLSNAVAQACQSSKHTADAFGEFLLLYFAVQADSKYLVNDLQRTQMVDGCYFIASYCMEHLIDIEELSKEDNKLGILSSLYQISRACPNLLAQQIPMLVSSIQSNINSSSPTNPGQKVTEEEKKTKLQQELITQYIIQVIMNSILFLKNPDSKLILKLEVELMLIINRGSQGSLVVAIPCLCHIIKNISRNYFKINKIMTSCLDLLNKAKKVIGTSDQLPRNFLPMTLRTLLIVGHVMRFIDFDEIKNKIPEDPLYKVLPNQKKTVNYSILDLLFEFRHSDNPTISAVAISALGQAMVHHTKFILREDVRTYLESVSENGSSTIKIELLRALLEFITVHDIQGGAAGDIAAESGIANFDTPSKRKKNESNSSLDVKVLIGNAEELSDAGISSALMQMYLPFVLKSLLQIKDSQMFTVAFRLFQVALEQGLVHPLLCVPYLVALETHPDVKISGKAMHVHSKLYEKHNSFMNAKNVECLEMAYKYQKMVFSADSKDCGIRGYREEIQQLDDENSANQTCYVALLSPLYSLIQSSKRQKRNEFLSTCVSLFDQSVSRTVIEDESQFLLFVAENLASLPYKTIDEVLFVLMKVNRFLSIVGASFTEKNTELNENQMARILILNCLKSYLKESYGINENKFFNYQPPTSKSNEKSIISKHFSSGFSLSKYGIELASLKTPETRKLLADKIESIMANDIEISNVSNDIQKFNESEWLSPSVDVTPSNRVSKRKPLPENYVLTTPTKKNKKSN